MSESLIRLNKKLLPLSWLYGAGVAFRNMLFEAGVLKSRSYAVPVISVGNITVGGTGKTPHVEYLAALLKDRLKVAVLSRGYKRKSHGFLLATSDTPMRLLGDEPWQIKHRFPDIAVAVDKKRTHGIETLLSTDETSGTDVILLDDAFQHRYVKPGINILLVEPLKSKDRADIVIITKCPKTLTPMDFRVLTKQMNLYPYQKLFFTTFSYDAPRPVFSEGSPLAEDAEAPLDSLAGRHVLLLTGIASPKQMLLDIQNEATPASITPMAFADHHRFSRKDIRHINEAFEALPQPRLVITTEKDAARLYEVEGLSPAVRQATYALPVKVSFMLDGEETFNETIRNYVLKNSRNSILATGKSETKVRRADKSEKKPLTISFK